MEQVRHKITKIENNPKNYKVCINCGSFNLAENINCHCCGNGDYFNFKTSEKEVADIVRFQINYFKNEENKTMAEINLITVPVKNNKV